MFSNLQYAVRSLSKTPWLTAVVVVTLAVGIAANTAVFSWTRGVLLNPLRGVADVAASLRTRDPPAGRGRQNIELSYPDFRDYRDSSQSLAGAIAFHERALSLGDGIQTERVWAQFVSGNFFDVLGVRAGDGPVLPDRGAGRRAGQVSGGGHQRAHVAAALPCGSRDHR